MSLAETAPAAPQPSPLAGRLRAAAVFEWMILVALLAAGAVTLLAAATPPSSETAMAQPVGQFFRVALVAVDPLGPLGVMRWRLLLGAAAAVLALLAVVPRVAPDARAVWSGYGFLLLLAPVLNYGPQRDVLAVPEADLSLLPGIAKLTAFHPILPVTGPLLAGLALAVIWVLVTPPAHWPAPFRAFVFVTAMICGGGWWLTAMLIRARGNALDLVHMQWPFSMETIWMVFHVGVAAILASLAGRDPLRSRLLAGLTAALLVVTALVAG